MKKKSKPEKTLIAFRFVDNGEISATQVFEFLKPSHANSFAREIKRIYGAKVEILKSIKFK